MDVLQALSKARPIDRAAMKMESLGYVIGRRVNVPVVSNAPGEAAATSVLRATAPLLSSNLINDLKT